MNLPILHERRHAALDDQREIAVLRVGRKDAYRFCVRETWIGRQISSGQPVAVILPGSWPGCYFSPLARRRAAPTSLQLTEVTLLLLMRVGTTW